MRFLFVLVASVVAGFSGAAQAQRRPPQPPVVQQQQGTGSSGAFSPETYCPAPQKFAAGACVTACPGGYADRGRVCELRRDN